MSVDSVQRTAYIGLGSNLGDRMARLREALQRLAQRQLRIAAASSVYESEPVGPVNAQPLFLNAVVRLQTELPADALLDRCLEIEQWLGRQRGQRFGPREIDLDLLLVGQERVETGDLVLPHPRLTARRFVLLPLLELAPNLCDPRDGSRFADHLTAVRHQQLHVYAGPAALQ